MFIQETLARESVFYVVITADSNQTVCYELRLFSTDVFCLYQAEDRFNLLRLNLVRRYR